MEAIDWTKYLVPRVNSNADSHAFGKDPNSLNTTDLVSLPSLSELDPQSPVAEKRTTDFARAFIARRESLLVSEPNYQLRTPGMYLKTGFDPSHYNHENRYVGIAPCISLKLPEQYTLAQLTEQLGLTKTTQNGKDVYQVRVGEWPRTQVTSELSSQLDDRFYGDVADDHFRCTGRLYTTPTTTTIHDRRKSLVRQNPEYKYHGEKYVRVLIEPEFGIYPSERRESAWYEVEPITWTVKNFDAVASGQATQIDLECAEVIMGGIPFCPEYKEENDYSFLWQNSMTRAFLNSADSRQLDGNPDLATHQRYWDFTQGGFLQQALNMTREPTRVYTIPAAETSLIEFAFDGCRGIEKIIVPAHVNSMHHYAFKGCPNAQIMIDITSELMFQFNAFERGMKFYVPKNKDDKWWIFSPYVDANLSKDYLQCEFDSENDLFSKLYGNENFLQNYIQLQDWKAKQQIKFIPPDFTMEIFPANEMRNYFVNNNHKRWADLVNTLQFNLLQGLRRLNSLTDLMKVYYALGGFSAHQGERDKAFDYVVQHVANLESAANMDEIERVKLVADEIHKRFSRLEIKGPHNPTFAKFFMKYYHENPDFMRFDFCADGEKQDYLCTAHNSFDKLLKTYPNRVVNGNTRRDLLTPQFVAEHCVGASYENVDEDNFELAETVGRYGYTQEQFEDMQKIYNQAKTQKDNYVIRADRAIEEKGVSFRVLAKDDPLGFVIGNITDCCQHIGGSGGSCVRDGYTNPNAGFLVFEESSRDKDGEPTENKRILGQAYIWYDPETQTVCYDNIEIPDNILRQLLRGDKHNENLSMSTLMQTVLNSADAIMATMNKNGVPVKRVTVGKGYTDLKLAEQFKLTKEPAQHRSYQGYTDATNQYLIRTYDETTAKLANDIMDTAEQIMQANKTAQNHHGRELQWRNWTES